MGTWLVGWLVGSIASWLIGVRVAVRVDVPGHRGAADLVESLLSTEVTSTETFHRAKCAVTSCRFFIGALLSSATFLDLCIVSCDVSCMRALIGLLGSH